MKPAKNASKSTGNRDLQGRRRAGMPSRRSSMSLGRIDEAVLDELVLEALPTDRALPAVMPKGRVVPLAKKSIFACAVPFALRVTDAGSIAHCGGSAALLAET